MQLEIIELGKQLLSILSYTANPITHAEVYLELLENSLLIQPSLSAKAQESTKVRHAGCL